MLLSHKTSIKISQEYSNIIGHMCYAAVSYTHLDGSIMSFTVEGAEDAQITVEMEAETRYEVFINDASTGVVETNLGGKLSFSVELGNAAKVAVKIVKR